MSNFIELRRRGKKRCRGKDLYPVLVNVNSIMCVQVNPYGGSRLTLYVDGLIERVMYVTSAIDEIFALIEKKRDVSPSISNITFDFTERLKCAICDDLCRHPGESLDQDELDAK